MDALLRFREACVVRDKNARSKTVNCTLLGGVPFTGCELAQRHDRVSFGVCGLLVITTLCDVCWSLCSSLLIVLYLHDSTLD